MPLVLNCLDEENKVTVGGNTFTFAPKQIKFFHNADISTFICRSRQDQGFVDLPEELEYLAHLRPGTKLEDAIDPEHKKLIEERRVIGVDNYVRELRRRVYNAQVSMRMDLEKANIKADPKVFATDVDLKNLEQLVKYQTKKDDAEQARIDKMKELEKKLSESSLK